MSYKTCDHHWVTRTPDPDNEPLLRVDGVAHELHLDEICIECFAYRTLVPHPSHPSQSDGKQLWLILYYS